ncbi:MAG: prepilin-type N-terminal cleavage/methylation domain-containing protein [Mariprofundaceae bacterium]|nr:prepilin-type N-terminal cleavage/methylation domain-containing protein [Mariprofundaceae bacterium]
MQSQEGFTLVEMIIAMAIGLVLMGGVYSNFMLQTKVQNFQSSVTDVTQDLTLVSQVMFKELKSARKGSLVYTPGATPSVPTTLDYINRDGYTGSFKYQFLPGLNTKYLGKDSLCWVKKTGGNCNEVMRGLSINTLDPDDLTVTLPLGFDFYTYILPPDPYGRPLPSDVYGMQVITLRGMYKTTDKKTGIIEHTFKVWQRN